VVETEVVMRVMMVEGDEHDAARLLELARRAGLDIEVRLTSVRELRATMAMTSRQDGSAGPELGSFGDCPGHAGPKALLFEAPDHPERGVAALTVVRASEAFARLPAFLSFNADHIEGFAGAPGFDDFVLHPWSPAELLGRVRVAELRRKGVEPEALLEINGVQLDKAAREIRVDGLSVHLTTRELALFTYLCARRGSVLSRNHLLEHVWGDGYHGGQRTVDVHIRRLRSKLGDALPIDTVRSGGYRLRAEARAAARSVEREAPLRPAAALCVEQRSSPRALERAAAGEFAR
jgi:DNA-binding response OmpR family regulator